MQDGILYIKSLVLDLAFAVWTFSNLLFIMMLQYHLIVLSVMVHSTLWKTF